MGSLVPSVNFPLEFSGQEYTPARRPHEIGQEVGAGTSLSNNDP